MAPGCAVRIPSGLGVVTVVVKCCGSSELMVPAAIKKSRVVPPKEYTDHNRNFYPKQTMIMKVYVRPEGVAQAWPFNPWDIESIAA